MGFLTLENSRNSYLNLILELFSKLFTQLCKLSYTEFSSLGM